MAGRAKDYQVKVEHQPARTVGCAFCGAVASPSYTTGSDGRPACQACAVRRYRAGSWLGGELTMCVNNWITITTS